MELQGSLGATATHMGPKTIKERRKLESFSQPENILSQKSTNSHQCEQGM
jgi:hypothetical protein